VEPALDGERFIEDVGFANTLTDAPRAGPSFRTSRSAVAASQLQTIVFDATQGSQSLALDLTRPPLSSSLENRRISRLTQSFC
jgi:hypothetical protein